jgi:hypothetical protein
VRGVNYVAQPSGGPAAHEIILENNIQANTQNLPLRVQMGNEKKS